MNHTWAGYYTSQGALVCATGAFIGFAGAEVAAQIGFFMLPGWLLNRAAMFTFGTAAALLGAKALFHVGAGAVFGSIAGAAWLPSQIVR